MRRVPLGEICRFEYGKSLPEKVRKRGNYAVYGSNGQVGRHESGLTSGKTIIVGRKGSIGEVHLSEHSCWPIDTTYFIDESCTDCDLEWLFYSLRYLRLDTLNKASGVPGLNREDVYKQEVCQPTTKKAQQRIAAQLRVRLTEVAVAQQAAETQTHDWMLLRQRVLRDALATLKDAPRKKLGEHAPTSSGTTPSRGSKRYWEPGEIPWVKTGEIVFAPIYETEESISSLALKECSLALLPRRTVLIAMYGQGKTRGQSAVLEIPAAINQACFAILPNKTWDSDFLFYWFLANYQELRSLSDDRGGNQANLNGALLKALEIPAPDIQKQLKISRLIKAALIELDLLQIANKTILFDLRRLPQSLLSQAFEN
jgi:type I restriction enzyme S subunit